MKIVNLINRTVNVMDSSGQMISYPVSGIQCRVDSSEEYVRDVNGIPCILHSFGKIRNLPPPEEDTLFIVSGTILHVIRKEFPERTDLICPNTSSGVTRNERGHIKFVTSFKCVG